MLALCNLAYLIMMWQLQYLLVVYIGIPTVDVSGSVAEVSVLLVMYQDLVH